MRDQCERTGGWSQPRDAGKRRSRAGRFGEPRYGKRGLTHGKDCATNAEP